MPGTPARTLDVHRTRMKSEHQEKTHFSAPSFAPIPPSWFLLVLIVRLRKQKMRLTLDFIG